MKDVVHDELSTGAKARGRLLLLFKYVAKLDLKAMQIDVNKGFDMCVALAWRWRGRRLATAPRSPTSARCVGILGNVIDNHCVLERKRFTNF